MPGHDGTSAARTQRGAAVARRSLGRIRAHPVTIPVLYILAGIGVGATMLLVDAVIGEAGIPRWLRVGPQVARSSLVGMVTSFLFVISVVFWVRIWAVQMTAQPVLPRVLSQFLTDRVQQHAMGFLIGGMAYALTVVRGIPEDGTGLGAVPHLAMALAYATTLAAAVIIVLVIHNAARASQVGRLVRQITDESVAFVRRVHPPIGEGADGAGSESPSPPPGPHHTVSAGGSGWVLSIDEGLLLGAVPPGSFVELGVRVGSFVIEGQRLARVWTEGEAPSDKSVRAAFVLGDEPSLRHNLSHGINELVDIATRSVTASSSDSTTVREAVLHLGVVMRELLLHDLPLVHQRDDEDRQLVRPQDLGFDDYCEASFGRIRDVAGQSHELMTVLLSTIETISHQLEDAQLWDRRALLQEHAHLVVEEARQRLTLPHSVERVARRARAAGVETDDASDDHARPGDAR